MPLSDPNMDHRPKNVTFKDLEHVASPVSNAFTNPGIYHVRLECDVSMMSGTSADGHFSYPVDPAALADGVLAHGRRENCLVLSPHVTPTLVPNVTPATTIYAPSTVLGPNNTPDLTQFGEPMVSPPSSVVANDDRECLNNALQEALNKQPSLETVMETEFDGVLENSRWQEAIEEDLAHALARLANLAEDDHKADRTKTAKEHYHARLSKLLKTSSISVDLSLLQLQ
ncbi:hypothetical protein MBLNU459_g5916t3 [Dothideomycetes sp. NU459]